MTTDSNIIFQDQQLMQKVSNDDATAFEKLYKKYHPAVTSYIISINSRHSVDSLTQEVFIRLWNGRMNFKQQSSIKTYLFAIAKNIVMEYQKRTYKRRTLQKGLIQHQQNMLPSQSASTDNIESYKQARQAISKLNKKQRQAFKLFHIDGLSLKDAAETTDCSIDAFCGRLIRARKRLRQLVTPKQ